MYTVTPQRVFSDFLDAFWEDETGLFGHRGQARPRWPPCTEGRFHQIVCNPDGSVVLDRYTVRISPDHLPRPDERLTSARLDDHHTFYVVSKRGGGPPRTGWLCETGNGPSWTPDRLLRSLAGLCAGQAVAAPFGHDVDNLR